MDLPAGAALTVTANLSLTGLTDAQLWWPWQMGAPTRHNLTMGFAAHSGGGRGEDDVHAWLGPAASKGKVVPVGLRSASNDLDANNNVVFRVNGRKILIRGGGWAPDLLQRMSPQRHGRMLRLTRDLGLNAIRLEGKLQDDDLFEQCDALGIMVLPGLCCCDAWQTWDVWTPNTHRVAADSLRSQAKRLRRFPSVVTFLYSSDELPPPDVHH